MINRRQWLCGMGIIAGAAAQPGRILAASKREAQKTASHSLSLAEFAPKSMLQAPETHVAQARFPVIDFHEKYQERILFGTDATPHGDEYPQQLFSDKLYEIYYRFLETDAEYFDYAPAEVPPQGRWRIYGVNLPETILRKVYFENAARQLNVVG